MTKQTKETVNMSSKKKDPKMQQLQAEAKQGMDNLKSEWAAGAKPRRFTFRRLVHACLYVLTLCLVATVCVMFGYMIAVFGIPATVVWLGQNIKLAEDFELLDALMFWGLPALFLTMSYFAGFLLAVRKVYRWGMGLLGYLKDRQSKT